MRSRSTDRRPAWSTPCACTESARRTDDRARVVENPLHAGSRHWLAACRRARTAFFGAVLSALVYGRTVLAALPSRLQRIRGAPRTIQRDRTAFTGDLIVVILGDSFVAGFGMDEEHRFTSILEREYDVLPAPHVKIVSLGFTSYSTML